MKNYYSVMNQFVSNDPVLSVCVAIKGTLLGTRFFNLDFMTLFFCQFKVYWANSIFTVEITASYSN